MFNCISLQSIKYQIADPFKKDLTGLIAEMYADIDGRAFKNNLELLESDYGKRMNKLIKDRFNLDVRTAPILVPISYMAIIPFSSDVLTNSDNNFVPNLASNFSEQEVNKINKAINDIIKENRKTAKAINDTTGEIDFKRAYVRGYPAKVRHHLLTDIFFVKQKAGLTAPEVAAVIAHEIGHAFTGLSEHFSMVRENKAIEKCIQHLNKNDIDKARYVFKSVFGAEELEKAKLDKSQDRTDFYGAIAKQYINKLDSRYKNSTYDETSFEYLADSFATNLGFGSELATALRKLTVYHTGTTYTNRWMSEMTFTVNVVGFVALLSVGTPGGIFAAFFLASLHLTVNWFRANYVNTYDEFKDRNIRVKREITYAIKTNAIPKEEMIPMIKQWEIVDELIVQSHNYQPMTVKLLKLIIPSLRREEHSKQQQQLSEEFMNNDLFVKTAKLKLLGDAK